MNFLTQHHSFKMLFRWSAEPNTKKLFLSLLSLYGQNFLGRLKKISLFFSVIAKQIYECEAFIIYAGVRLIQLNSQIWGGICYSSSKENHPWNYELIREDPEENINGDQQKAESRVAFMANQFLHITSLVNIQVELILNKAKATNATCLVFFSFVSWYSQDYGKISVCMQKLDQKHSCAEHPLWVRYQGDMQPPGRTSSSLSINRAYKKDGERHFTRACGDRARAKGFKL